MKQVKKALGVISGMVLAMQLSCKDAIVDTPIKDPRTYTWTIDTLAYPGSFQTSMRDIWGSSASDVYVVGHNYENSGLMWHYNGKIWQPVGLNPFEGGTITGSISLKSVLGFSKSNIWAVGDRVYNNYSPPPNLLDSSLVIAFDGQKWFEHKIHGGRRLTAIGGASSFDLWTGGWTNYLYHFNGVVWKKDSLPVVAQHDGIFQINSLESLSSGEILALGNTFHNAEAKTIYYYFLRKSGVWRLLDSAFVQPGRVENKWGFGDLWVSPPGTAYSCGVGIYRWNGSSWEKLFDHANFLTRITGTSDNNIFVVGHLGTVLHYNGQDWFQYPQFADPNNVLWGVWTDGKEVMFTGFTARYPQKTLIFHGR